MLISSRSWLDKQSLKYLPARIASGPVTNMSRKIDKNMRRHRVACRQGPCGRARSRSKRYTASPSSRTCPEGGTSRAAAHTFVPNGADSFRCTLNREASHVHSDSLSHFSSTTNLPKACNMQHACGLPAALANMTNCRCAYRKLLVCTCRRLHARASPRLCLDCSACP